MSNKDKAASKSPVEGDKIIIRLWPKTPVLYPMAILALICGIVGQIYGIPQELIDAKKESLQEVREVTRDAEVIPNVEEPEPVVTPEAEKIEAGTPEPASPQATEEVETVPLALRSGIDKKHAGTVHTVMALVFLAMLSFSLFVVCIDFEVRWSLLVFVILLMIIMGLVMADRFGIVDVPNPLGFIDHLILYATPLFYFCIFGIWVLLMIVSAIIARFHFVKIDSNEVVVMSGVLETQKRMSTFRMHYTKEIQDIFEYYLPFVRSGRLVFTFPNEEQPLIMDNVIGINKVLKKLDKSSSAFQVREVE